MSRHKDPTALKVIKGTFRQDRAQPNEPTPEVGIPPAPAHLAGDALAEWQRVTPLLEACNMLAKIDLAILAMYCDAWARYLDLQRATEELGRLANQLAMMNATTTERKQLIRTLRSVFGEIEVGEKGVMQIRALATARRYAAQDVHRFAVELGLSALSRTRINLPPAARDEQRPKNADPAEKFFA